MSGRKPLSKSKVIETIAERAGHPKADVKVILDALAEVAYEEAKYGFTIPGIGKLVVVDRKERQGRNPATGEPITIPAKRVLKFRIAKAAKDASL